MFHLSEFKDYNLYMLTCAKILIFFQSKSVVMSDCLFIIDLRIEM